MTSERELTLFLVSINFEINNDEDMIYNMKKSIQLDSHLNSDELDLISQVCKKIIKQYINSIKSIELIEKKVKTIYYEQLIKYKDQIVKEFTNFCNEIIEMTESQIVPMEDVESKNAFLSLRGDIYGYISQYKSQDEKKEYVNKAINCYERAFEDADQDIFDGYATMKLDNKYAVFLHDIIGNKLFAITFLQNELDRYNVGVVYDDYKRDYCLFEMESNLLTWKKCEELE